MSTREQTLKQAIQENLQAFNDGSLTPCGLALFETLGYRVDKRSESDDSPSAFLVDFNDAGLLNSEKALVTDWEAIDLLFQLTKDEIIGGNQLRIDFGNNNRVDNTIIESYLFFGLRLRGERYSRTQLATITREINKLFLMPVMLLFQYGQLQKQAITLSVINRRLNKRDESRDVLEKVTLIKDIAVTSPHRAHIEILFDLSLEQLYKAHKFSNFVDLHRAWQKTLDSSELNKRFFKEVADWYFWATQQVVFPTDAPKDEEGQNSISVIRMITRLIFVWFLKEKGLVPEELFNRSHIDSLIHFDDSSSSSYYKAILQNLFFATLNQPMNRDKLGSRKFRSEGKGSRDGHYMIHNVYRYRALMKKPDTVEQLLAEVPFLNGGLFECLDQTTDDKHPIRIDGFSDRADNLLSVPNYLFFTPEQDVDLNVIYGTKNKRYKVCGLIDILNRYKFTITENTPIEEEIALDPELLGKVFENLLASYNQETRVTARKQTGSFYTPREVVDYMVDESLIVYLATQLLDPESVDEADRGELEQRLRVLLDYSSAENPFADRPEEQLLLIVAIDQLKVLDPAVGSGAFPMGILQKLVFILGKLDPDNKLWKFQQKEREIRRVQEDVRQAQQISYEEARDAAIAQLKDRLKEIEDDFENNERDYSRKLFLIENCIYGVDIQPIAVQIAKLRFFISLVVEQTVSEQLPNRGVLPLPNLETKFVVANTLIGIDRPDRFGQTQLFIRDPRIEQIENELRTTRHKIFTARTSQTKQNYRVQDQALRTDLAELLKVEGLSGETAKRLAQWNPYDQNASTDFFDSDWMFGAKEGFDVVIGNPPYVRQEQIKHLKEALKAQFECFTGTADLYVFFYERGLKLLRSHGVLTYISSNKYFRAAYGQKLRHFLASRSRIHQIIDFGDAPVFTAIAYPTIVIMENIAPNEQRLRALNWNGQPVEQLEAVVQQDSFWMPQSELKAQGWQLAEDEPLRLLERLRKVGTPLGEYVKGRFYRGILTGFNEAFVVDRETRDRLIAEHPLSEEVLKPFLRGRDVKRWRVEYQDLWLIFTRRGIEIQEYPAIHNHLLQFKARLTPGCPGGRKPGSYKWYEIQDNIAYWHEFEQPKIVIPSIENEASYAIDLEKHFTNDKTSICCTDSPEYLLGLLNSKLLFWVIQQTAATRQGGFYEFKPMYVSKLPIAQAPDHNFLEAIVKYVIYLHQYNISNLNANLIDSAQDKLMLEYFEQLIDAIVYELYLPEDLHAHNFTFAQPLQAEILPDLDDILDNKLEAIRTVFQRLYAQDHLIRHNLFLLDTIPVIRLIEGKA